MRKKFSTRNFKKISQLKPDLPLVDIYRNCFELPLNIWVKVNVTKDLKYLTKAGEPSVEELYTAWNAITDEFRSLSKDLDSTHSFDLQKEIYTDDQDIIVITAIVNYLRMRRVDELITILQNNFNFRFDYVDLNADLDKTLTVANGRIMQLKLKEKDLKDLTGDQKPKEDTTEFDYIEQLVVLSEDNHYRIDINTITVAEYIALYNKFKSKVQAQLAQQQNA